MVTESSSASGGPFLGAIDKRKKSPISKEQFERDRNELVAFFQANFNHAEMQVAGSLLAMEVRALRQTVATNLDTANELQSLVAMVRKVNSDLEAKLGAIAEEAARLGLHHGIKAGGVQMARKGGNASAEKMRTIKAFAVKLFDDGTWKNTSAAAVAIWDQVKAESVRLGRPLTDTRGPQSLYGWLLKHKKTR
jgi:hypothetical protein